MTATRPSPTTPGTFLCPRCGSAMRDDQAWCMECGLAARTRVDPPPNWRVPIAVTLVVLVLAGAAIAYALVVLLDEQQGPSTPATVTTVVPPAATPAPGTPVDPSATTPGATPAPGTATPGSAAVPGTETAPSGGAVAPGTETTPDAGATTIPDTGSGGATGGATATPGGATPEAGSAAPPSAPATPSDSTAQDQSAVR